MNLNNVIGARFPNLLEDMRYLRNGMRRSLPVRLPSRENSDYYRSKLICRYTNFYGRQPNLDNPTLFSEKLCKQMIEIIVEGSTCQTELSDKVNARKIIEKIVGDRYLNEVYWVGDRVEDAPLNSMPYPSVIKTSHGSGGNFILRANSDLNLIRRKLRNWLAVNYFFDSLEYQYYQIKPQILVERFLRDEFEDGPRDYRFFCFDGKPFCVQVDNNSHSINPFYDLSWNKIGLRYRERAMDVDVAAPKRLDIMIDLAKKISAGHPFVRVDFFDSLEGVYFCEMTFAPVSGLFKFNNSEWDRILGDQWGVGGVSSGLSG